MQSIDQSIRLCTWPQIHADVREFWGQVEGLAAARHTQLVGTLNQHLAHLAHQVRVALRTQ